MKINQYGVQYPRGKGTENGLDSEKFTGNGLLMGKQSGNLEEVDQVNCTAGFLN